MAGQLYERLPDHEVLLGLEPEELAGTLLELLKAVAAGQATPRQRTYWVNTSTLADYPAPVREAVARAVSEAWTWLEAEGLIAVAPGGGNDVYFVTRRGQKLTTRDAWQQYRHARVLPRDQLLPSLQQKVWSTFVRGDYDTAVFQAFKEVEIAVRTAGKLPAKLVGIPLMMEAFKRNDKDPTSHGPLFDASLVDTEQDAQRFLFAGAMGWYRNPTGHRHVGLDDPAQAAEAILFANQLLRMVATLSEKLGLTKGA